MNDVDGPHRGENSYNHATASGRPRHQVCIVLYDGMERRGFSRLAAALRTANARETHIPSYRVRTASWEGSAVTTADGHGLVPDCDLAAVGDVSTVVLPGAAGIPEFPKHAAETVGRLLRVAKRVAVVSTGAFLLGEVGLLSKRTVTTHRQYAEELARRFPSAFVIPGEAIRRHGHVISCASDAFTLELAQALINEDIGRESARRAVAVMNEHVRGPRQQSPLTDTLGRASRHPGLLRAQRRVKDSPRGDLSISTLARHAGLSERQFTRLFRSEVGLSVQQYVQRFRILLASELLLSTSLDIADIARAVGFGGEHSLTRLFSQVVQAPPEEYRARARGAAASEARITSRAEPATRRP